MGRPRTDQCSNGHLWTDANTKMVRPPGRTPYRLCRHCIRARGVVLRAKGQHQAQPVPPPSAAIVIAAASLPEQGGQRHTIFDMYSPQHPEPDRPMPPLRLFGPFGGPGAAMGKR